MRIRGLAYVALGAWLWMGTAPPLAAAPPAQSLPSAVLVYPYIVAEGGGKTRDTRVELLNLSARDQNLSCTYVIGDTCGQFGFSVRLTPNQPISWLASRGTFNSTSRTAIPPFNGTGELKCRVLPVDEKLSSHNAIQGRAIVFGLAGETIAYGAVGFRRLVEGEASGVVELDGATYEQCPDKQHFAFVASEPGAMSELVIAPCAEDLENRIPSRVTIQFLVINEFEQLVSASTSVTCVTRLTLEQISHVFRRETMGSETGHLILHGVQSPVLSMLIDRLDTGSATAVAGNEPAFEGGRAATIRFPF